MSKKPDYYSILGVSREAGDSEIKKAFRRLAMRHHPDRNPDDAKADAKFKEIQEAYQVLSDSQKRQIYDRYGHEGLQAGQNTRSSGFSFGDAADIFRDIFGTGSSNARGADLGYELNLTLEQAVFGTTEQIQIPVLVTCAECKGSGAKKGTTPQPCPTCHGHGEIHIRQGFMALQQTCYACNGSGKIIKSPCKQCHGQGRVRDRKMLSVKIPAGVDTGDRIRLSGEGEAGAHGSSPGDLYVEVHIKPHEIFTRKGHDLYTQVPISFVTAALGGEVKVPTLQGQVSLKIPEETQTGKSFRLRSRGVKGVRSNTPGDLICRAVIETPVKLTDEQKSHLRSFDEMLAKDLKNHRPQSKSWLDSVKEFFKE